MINVVNTGLDSKYFKDKKKIITLNNSIYFDKKNLNQNYVKSNFIWDDIKYKKKFAPFLKKLHSKIYPNLCHELNKIHKVNYSNKNWNLLVNPWLMHYLESVYFRWILVTSFVKNKKIEIIYFNNLKSLPIFDQNEFQDKISSSDVYNQYFFQRIYKFLKENNNQKIKFRYIKKKISEKKYYPKNYYYSWLETKKIKQIIIETVDAFFSLLFSKQKYFYDLNIGKNLLIKISFFTFTIPFKGYFWFKNKSLLKFFNKKINKNILMRNKIDLKFDKNKHFEKFLNIHFKNDIPQSLLEKFYIINKHTKKIPFKPKVIFSDSRYISTTMFKFWLAHRVNKGSKLVTSDHGGLYGNGRRFMQYDSEVSNVNIKWQKVLKKTQFQLPAIHLNKYEEIRKNKIERNKILIVGHDSSKYPKYYNTGPLSEQLLHQEDLAKKFYLNLRRNLQNCLFFKPYMFKNWWLFNRYMEFFGKKKILMDTNSFHTILSESKIVVSLYPKTAFMQAFVSGPTILLINSNHYEETPKLEKIFKIMKKEKIAFENAEQAARHINKIWDNVDAWWGSKKIRMLRKIISNEFGNSDDKYLSSWRNFIKKN